MDTQTESTAKPNEPAGHEYVLSRYQSAIKYYWKAGNSNKRSYKQTRSVTVSLGALVTLISSLASASFIADNNNLSILFAVMTPILAAILTPPDVFSQLALATPLILLSEAAILYGKIRAKQVPVQILLP